MPETQLIQSVAPHSVEISRNASGGVSISVKCYGATVEDASEKARKMFADLDSCYPVQAKK